MLTIAYNGQLDRLYLYLVDSIAPGQARWQVPFDSVEPELLGLVADLSEDGRLLGIEVTDASRRLVWPQASHLLGPPVSVDYEAEHDVVRLSFGGRSVKKAAINESMFPEFLVEVWLDAMGRVTDLVVPLASRQLGSASVT